MRRKRTKFIPISIAALLLLSLVASIVLDAPRSLVAAFPMLQAASPTTCREIDRSWIELKVLTASESGFEAGRVLSFNDGTLAAIVITSDVDANGAVTKLDYATSVRVNAIIVAAGDALDIRKFDPPVRSGVGISMGDGNPIDSISFCYQVSIPSPPKATTSVPDEQETRPAIEPTSTELTLDVSGVKTAEARSIELAATATGAAAEAATELADAKNQVDEIAATATAAAESAVSSDAALAATITAQLAEIATAETKANDARATADSLQATLSAPTQTPTATETPEPEVTPESIQPVTTIVYETTGATPFADWQPVNGWDLNGEVAKTDGSGDRGWLIVPVPTGLSVDAIVVVEFRVTGGEICPRNFGFGMRGSATGFYAAGIEWACDPDLVLWAGSKVIDSPATQPLPDPGDDWHTLQISTVGSQISVAIDGISMIEATDDSYPAGNLVAFWTDGVGLEVRRVQVSEISS